MLLKAGGYYFYQKTSRIINEFLDEFVKKKNEELYGEGAHLSKKIQESTEQLVLKDMRASIRGSTLLYEQEWQGYLQKIFDAKSKLYKFELQLNEKTLVQKTAELEQHQRDLKKVLKDKQVIEIDSLREGFKIVLKSKFFNEWRSVKAEKLRLK